MLPMTLEHTTHLNDVCREVLTVVLDSFELDAIYLHISSAYLHDVYGAYNS